MTLPTAQDAGDSGASLAIEGAPPAKERPDPPMYPGGMAIDAAEERAVLEVLRTKRLYRFYGPQPGPSKTDELERAFAAATGARHALAVSSGTQALICGLAALGVGPGDEVIVPAYTWVSSPEAVLAVGAIPIIVEVDASLTLDPQAVEAAVTPYTRAIMPVHMRGAPCRMQELLDIAARHGLALIEDVAQANGATYRGRRLGTLGDVGCFSLQFQKIITSGEGGVVVSDREELWQRAAMFHDPVGGRRFRVPSERILWGINCRLAELLAAVALVQLGRLEGLVGAMRERKKMLKVGLRDVVERKGLQFREIPDPEGEASVALVLYTQGPDVARRVTAALQAENISATMLYAPDQPDYHIYSHWLPIMEQRSWSHAGGPWIWARREIRYAADMCPRTLDLLGRAVHLNVNPLYSNEDIEQVLDGATRVLDRLT
ncbi:MAG: DegT/DnrJ/EryC1/StrS family aminotransferase [Chloroflexota bacterium]